MFVFPRVSTDQLRFPHYAKGLFSHSYQLTSFVAFHMMRRVGSAYDAGCAVLLWSILHDVGKYIEVSFVSQCTI